MIGLLGQTHKRFEPGVGTSGRLRAPGGGEYHQYDSQNLQRAQRTLRPSPPRREKHRTAGFEPLPLLDALVAALVQRPGPGPPAGGQGLGIGPAESK